MGPLRPVGGGLVRGARAPRAAGGFAVPDGAAAPAVAATGAATALGGLLALQQAESREPAEQRARRHAAAALRDLAGLQAELLGAGADPARRARLEALALDTAEDGETSVPPALAEILAEVRLRARVELARRRPAQGPSSI
jgi:hypothetical protein